MMLQENGIEHDNIGQKGIIKMYRDAKELIELINRSENKDLALTRLAFLALIEYGQDSEETLDWVSDTTGKKWIEPGKYRK